jgi:hypothetical protein
MNDLIIDNEALRVNEDEASIQRCSHDEENPYALISRALIRDASISPECRWLIMYFLSMKDGWKINMKQLIAHLKPHMGRDKVYIIMNEAIEAGYMKREETKTSKGKNKLFTQTKYFVSEKPKFKNSFRRPGFQDTENTDIKGLASEKDEYIEYNSSLKVPEEPNAAKAAEVESKPSSKQKRDKSDFPPKVREIANLMVNELHAANPDWLIPKNLHPMMVEIENMLVEEKREAKKIIDVFMWTVADSFWMDKLCKPNPAKYLRSHFGQLAGKMNAKPPKNPNEVDRRLRDKDGNVVDEWKDRLF